MDNVMVRGYTPCLDFAVQFGPFRLRAKDVTMSSSLSTRLLLSVCLAGSVSASLCATAQVAASPKKDLSQEAVVFDRFYNVCALRRRRHRDPGNYCCHSRTE